jgi:hypothetical protein
MKNKIIPMIAEYCYNIDDLKQLRTVIECMIESLEFDEQLEEAKKHQISTPQEPWTLQQLKEAWTKVEV